MAVTPVPWHALVLTLWPQMFPGPLGISLPGRALEKQIWSLETTDIRGFATDRHGSVDDTPAGGGPGMVMRADIVAGAIDHAGTQYPDNRLIHLSPRGRPLTQSTIAELAAGPGITLLCGRFEGIDQRVLDARNVEEISIGDYILSGGEMAAMVLLDGAVRLLPGVIGSHRSLIEESFENGLLEYPHYTRPRLFEGVEIPSILLSGDHGAISRWRAEQSRKLTRARRPDLWRKFNEKLK